MDFFRMHINELKQLPGYGKGVIAHYEKTQTHLHRFLKVMGWEKIRLNELSCKFIERFEHYLLTTPNAQTGRPMNGRIPALLTSEKSRLPLMLLLEKKL
ncbi:MAG: phage integrase SAM-like domain-containing protein [Bacteroidia bacterium]